MHFSQSLLAEALRLANRYQLGWFDALIVGAAVEGECSVPYTENMQQGLEVGQLRVVNPFL